MLTLRYTCSIGTIDVVCTQRALNNSNINIYLPLVRSGLYVLYVNSLGYMFRDTFRIERILDFSISKRIYHIV